MKPIVLIQPGDHRTVVISPLHLNSHTEGSWNVLSHTIADACIQVIDGESELSIENILLLVKEHPEWKCQAVEGISVPTWNLVE